MTCIVGLVDGGNGNIWMGGDSAGVGGFDLRVRADEKVFIKDKFIFGFTSSFRMGQILRYKLVIPPYYPEVDLYQYMVDNFIDAVRRCFKDSGYMKTKDTIEEGGTFLVGYRGTLFEIEDDFQVAVNVVPYNACGCGRDYALGSLATSEYMTASVPRMEEAAQGRVRKALEVAEQFSAGVRGPFHILKLEG